MNIRKSETENDIVTVTIRVSPEEFEKALKEAYLEHTERFTVPGYAAGLAPREALEQVYGHTTLYDEALDLCVPHLFNRFLQETETRIVGRPKVTEITWLAGGGVDFTVEAARYPEIELGVYKGLGVSVRREENEDIFSRAVLEAALKGMRGEASEAMVEQKLDALAAKERLAVNEDAIYHVLADTIDILKQAYEHSGISRPGEQIRQEALDVMLQTVSGDQKEVSMDFFQSQVRELVQRYRSLPEDFDEKFKSAASLRAKKKASMTPEEQANEVFDAYLGTLGLNEKKWREERRRQAAAAARCDLLLEAVAEAEHMTVSPADLEAMLSEIAQRCGLEVEQVREEADLEPIRRQLLRDKAYRLLLDTAEGQEEQVC